MAIQSPGYQQFYHTLAAGDGRATSLTSLSFAWLLPEAWEGELEAVFSRAKDAAPSHLGIAPSYIRKSRHPCPRILAQWLLTNSQRQPLAWAEAQSYQGAIHTIHLYLGALDRAKSAESTPLSRESMTEAMAFLISACFLRHQADVVKLVSHCATWQSLMAEEELGERRQIVVPTRQFGLLGVINSPSFIVGEERLVDAASWQQHPLGQRVQQKLGYLTLRNQKPDRFACPGPRRPNFWQRMFSGKRRPRKDRDAEAPK